MLKLTKFNGLSATGRPIQTSWESLTQQKLNITPTKLNAPATGFYELGGDGKRKNQNVLKKNCLVVDIDHPTMTIDEIAGNIKDLQAILLTSWSHDPETNSSKYRLIINTDRSVIPEEYKNLFRGFVQKYPFLLGQIDTSVNDHSRMFFDWSISPDRKHLAKKVIVKGDPIRVDEILKHHKNNQLSQSEKQDIGVTVDYAELLSQGVEQGDKEFGGRHIALTKLIGHLLAKGFPHDELINLCLTWNLKNKPPLPKEEVIRAVEDLIKLNKSKETVDENSSGLFNLLTIKNLQKMPPMKWLVKKLLPEKGLACVFGPSGSSKSFLCLDLALSIASQPKWFDLKVNNVPVLYIALEGVSGIGRRLDAWIKYKKIIPKYFFTIIENFNLSQKKDVQKLQDSIKKINFQKGLIIIDTFSQASPGMDENSVQDMTLLLSHLKQIQEHSDSLVLIVAHSGKDASRGLRGSSCIRAAMDTVLEVSSISETNKQWTVEKSKDSQDGGVYKYQLKEMILGLDEDNQQITSCVVKSGEHLSFIKAKPSGKNQLMAYKQIESQLEVSPIKGLCSTDQEQPLLELEDAINHVAKGFISTEKSKRRNQAKNVLQNLIANGFVKLGAENGKEYIWI